MADSWVQEECERAAKRNAHNQHMRFWRSLQPKGKAPPHLLAHYENIKGRRGSLTVLFEDFVQAKEDGRLAAPLGFHSTCCKQQRLLARADACHCKRRSAATGCAGDVRKVSQHYLELAHHPQPQAEARPTQVDGETRAALQLQRR